MATAPLLFIDWHPDPVMLRLGGFELHYYSILFALGLILAYLGAKRIYKDKGIAPDKLDPLFVYAFLGILVGARLGHCLFYEPGYYLSHPVEMLLPIRDTPTGWQFTGYQGLASHGGALGLIIALWLYVRRTRLNFVDILDFIAIVTPLTACFIRLGNLMNGEIVGKPTDVPWAFLFDGYDEPRHPAQLYEALAYLCFFIMNVIVYMKLYRKERLHRGFMFGLTLATIFTFRFFIEFLKDVQVDFERGMTLDMGQWLSIPFVIIGVACMIGGRWLDKIVAKAEFKDAKGKKNKK